MRLRKKRSVGQFMIDLTPLLDVIFIMLIVVLTVQTQHGDDAAEKLEEAQRIEAEAKDQLSALDSQAITIQEQLETYHNLNEYINVITICADYQPSNRKYRTVYLVINDQERKLSLNPSNGDTVWAECKAAIEQCLSENPDVPMIYSVLSSKMLYRDEQKIKSLFDELSSSYDNIYLKQVTEKADE